MVRIELPDERATAALGRRLAGLARRGDVLALSGPLGAGKTALARGFLRGRGETGEVPSPTFTLVQTYDLPDGPVWHFDLYRLDRPEDALELGVEEAFHDAISLVEWPDRLGGLLPARRLLVALDMAGAGRVAALDGWTDRPVPIVPLEEATR